MKLYGMVLVGIFFMGPLCAGDDIVMPAYTNQITNIDYIVGHTRCTIIIDCKNQDPIINYAPLSYSDFEGGDTVRLYMPQTTIECSFDDSFGSVETTGSGVEILLFGRLLQKIVSGCRIMIIFECAT